MSVSPCWQISSRGLRTANSSSNTSTSLPGSWSPWLATSSCRACGPSGDKYATSAESASTRMLSVEWPMASRLQAKSLLEKRSWNSCDLCSATRNGKSSICVIKVLAGTKLQHNSEVAGRLAECRCRAESNGSRANWELPNQRRLCDFRAVSDRDSSAALVAQLIPRLRSTWTHFARPILPLDPKQLRIGPSPSCCAPGRRVGNPRSKR